MLYGGRNNALLHRSVGPVGEAGYGLKGQVSQNISQLRVISLKSLGSFSRDHF